MEIVYVISLSKGGLPHYVVELANAVAKSEDVTVLKPTETSADDAISEDVTVIETFDEIEISIPDIYKLNFNPLESARSLASYRNLSKIEELDPDVVHDPMGLFAHVKLFSYLSGVGSSYPFVVTYHELTQPRYPISHPPMFVSHLIKDSIPNVPLDAGAVHTEEQASILRSSSYRPTVIDVIPHGAYDFFTGYDYERRSEEDDCLLFFGNVIEEKGIDVLIRAVEMVAEEIPDVNLLIAGDGSLSKESRRIIDRNPENFEHHDYFIPNDEVGTLFSRAQAVMLPYRSRGGRGHSGALSTAFSFEKPVVASDAGDFPRQVGESGCGLVVPSGDAEALAEGIVRTLTDDQLRAEMADNSRRMREKHSWDNVSEQYLDLYEKAIVAFERSR